MKLKRHEFIDANTGELVMVAVEHEYGVILINTSHRPNRQACENIAMLDLMRRYEYGEPDEPDDDE